MSANISNFKEYKSLMLKPYIMARTSKKIADFMKFSNINNPEFKN